MSHDDRDDDFSEDLAKLQVRLKDALAGFDELAKKAEPEIAGIIQEFISLHTTHEAAVSQRLSSLGCTPDPDGSFFSSVQRAVVKARAFFDDLDAEVLEQVVSGEEWIERLYDEAISSAYEPADTALLGTQRAELTALIDKTRKLSD